MTDPFAHDGQWMVRDDGAMEYVYDDESVKGVVPIEIFPDSFTNSDLIYRMRIEPNVDLPQFLATWLEACSKADIYVLDKMIIDRL